MAVSIPAAVQTALFERLTAHFLAAGKSWPVYDHVPDNAAVSCVQIGLLVTQTDDIMADEYSIIVVPIVGWSLYAGQAESHDINAEVRAALHEQPLPLDNGSAYQVSVTRQMVDRNYEGDAVAYEATSIVTIKIQH